MIVTNVGGLPKMVIDGATGLVAEPNVESIVEHVLEYFNLGEQHFIQNLQIEKNKLSWDSFSKSVIKLYYDIQK
jgi:glycosyltransferase involved in cell wall biosynthesis